MQALNFPDFEFKLKRVDNKTFIFDEIRRKHILLTPEEWVRQNLTRFLVSHLNYPKGLIAIEKTVELYGMKKRADVIACNNSGAPLLLAECKAPEVKLSQKTIDQAVKYNFQLKVKYLLVTNGISHICCEIDYKKMQYSFLENIPKYKQILHS